MTARGYYHDAYRRAFSARIVERFAHGDAQALILDETYFYPESGGQPADEGSISGLPLLGLFVREGDQAIVHVVGGNPPREEVQGEIAWARRFDHMQQHTGQHILSQAFIQEAGAQTVGFHLSDNTVTIDLDKEELSPEAIHRAEWLANTIVWENRPLRVDFVSPEEAAARGVRKVAEGLGERVRLVEIADFDRTACGGTHVAATGAVGVIKVLGSERRGDQLRISFACGGRALRDYRAKDDVLSRLAGQFTTGYDALEHAVNNLREDVKALHRRNKRLDRELLSKRADELLASAQSQGSAQVIEHAFAELNPGALRVIGKQVIQKPGTVALLGIAGEKSHLLFARADDAPGDMNELIKEALPLLGEAAGGGSNAFAQGGGPPAGLEQVQKALAHARRLLVTQLR